jgi:GTP-binding protein
VPVVVLVGRPNVGKSALANRLVGRRVAIVEPHSGVTRDRNVLSAQWTGRTFQVVDTGGLEEEGGELSDRVGAQVRRAVADADLVLLVADASVGVTREDEAVAAWLRRTKRPVVVVANKVDSTRRETDAWDLVRLGLGDPEMVSALHGRGAGELLDRIVERLPAAEPAQDGTARRDGPARGDGRQVDGPAPAGGPAIEGDEAAPRALDGTRPGRGGSPDETEPAEDEEPAPTPAVAIVGRPNVGKSTLLNRIAREDRVVVHDQPGTTRDAVDTIVETEAGSVRFVDTAGLRRAGRIDEPVEYYSLVRALQAIDRADVALLVIDASIGVTHQDQRLAERIEAAGSPVVVVLNKWELLDTEAREDARVQVADRLAFLGDSPVLAVSAKTGLGTHRLVPAISASLGAYRRRVSTRELNQLIQEAQTHHPAPAGRVLYAVQGATDPPTITLFATRTLPPTWLRYLERRIKERFGLGATPLKLRVRRRGAR